MKVKTQCTYGRGGEEINDTTRHDYVSLELNTLRVGKKMEIRVVYKHTPFPPPSLRLVTLFSLSLALSHLSSSISLSFPSPLFLHFCPPPPSPFIVQERVNRERRSGRVSDVGWKR